MPIHARPWMNICWSTQGSARINGFENRNTSMSFYIRLIETTDRNRREMEAQEKVQKMLNGEMSREEYKRFLMDLYHIVLHFCPIMAAAASRCADSFDAVRYHLYHNI